MFKLNNLTKTITTLGLVAGLGLVSIASIVPTQAAGVAIAISPSTSIVSTASTVNLVFTSSVAHPAGSKINVIFPNAYTGTTTTANTTLNGAAPTSVVSTASGTTNSMATITNATAIPAGTAITIAFSGLTTPSVIGNYSFVMYTSRGDYSATLQYVGEANVVNVTAFVPLNLSFVIRDNADTVNTNTCDMGILVTTAIGNCDYRLKVGTNATNGYVVSVQTSGEFTNGTYNFVNAATGAAGTAIAAGTETYGVNATAGAITSGVSGITLATPYGTAAGNAIRYNNTTAAVLATATGPNAPATTGDTTNTILVNHKAAINANTRAGVYN